MLRMHSICTAAPLFHLLLSSFAPSLLLLPWQGMLRADTASHLPPTHPSPPSQSQHRYAVTATSYHHIRMHARVGWSGGKGREEAEQRRSARVLLSYHCVCHLLPGLPLLIFQLAVDCLSLRFIQQSHIHVLPPSPSPLIQSSLAQLLLHLFLRCKLLLQFDQRLPPPQLLIGVVKLVLILPVSRCHALFVALHCSLRLFFQLGHPRLHH
mmetsp:Transcript_16377/g.41541  ORF Transcript_16377/g.41541 Transcript_16377/m.41541 type:complete len:210 (+) Transcript_16377:473-1102(+)